MIVSHQHKFIFIKPQKTAGTSVELLLSRICGSQDIITPLGYDPDPNVRVKNKAKAPQNYQRPKPLKHWELREVFNLLRRGEKPNLNYWEHMQATAIKQYVGSEIWQEYLKISIVRNPWDHAVSLFKWMSHHDYEGVSQLEFNTFLRERYKRMWPFYAIKNIYQVDFMLRFEHLNDDIKKLAEHLPLDDLEIPVTKHKIRQKKSYKEMYDEASISLVRKMNQNVFSEFDYQF
ncbi:MAG: sulfotransferase family 2 domain-containing protein [Bacteroidota bacterium]